MTGCFRAAAAGAMLAAMLGSAACKQPVHSTAPSSTATSGVVAAPATSTTDATAAGATATQAAPAANADVKAARKEVREACRDDLKACRDAGGDTRPMRCLRAKVNQLKPDCREALQTMMAERREGRGGRHAR